MTEPHAAIRARFPAYRAGLLDADSARELRAHLRACAECRAAFEPFAELSSEEEQGRHGHVPLALLARWDDALARLPAAERALLEAHLAACPQCAAGAEFSRRMRLVPARQRWRGRAGFLAAGTAALVASLLVVVLRNNTPERPPVLSKSEARRAAEAIPPGVPERTLGMTTSPAPMPAPTPARVRRAAVVQLGHGTRGGGGGQRILVPAGTTALPLRVPPLLGVGPAVRIRIDVTGPGGEACGHADLENRRLFGETAPAAVEASAPEGGALPAGHYEVSAVSDAKDPDLPGNFQRADYGFDLELQKEPPVAP